MSSSLSIASGHVCGNCGTYCLWQGDTPVCSEDILESTFQLPQPVPYSVRRQGRACVPMTTTSCAAAVMPHAMGAVATMTCASQHYVCNL